MNPCFCTPDCPPIDYAIAARYARCDASFLPQLQAVAQGLDEGFRYTVCYRIYPVRAVEGGLDLGFCRTDSRDLARFLQGADEVVVFGATVGVATDRAVLRYGKTQPTQALFADAIGVERIEALCDAFCRMMAGTTDRFSPGYGDLPLAMQQDIFRALPLAKLGMTLGPQLLITPTKSVTALVARREL